MYLVLQGTDGSLLRVEPLGSDEDGNIYWFFYGTRLYSEPGKKKKKTNNENTPGRGKGARGRGKSGKTGGRKRNNKDEQPQKAESPVVTAEDSDWKIACSTAEEWEDLIDNLRQSKKAETKRLCNYLNDELFPDVLYSIQQKVSE